LLLHGSSRQPWIIPRRPARKAGRGRRAGSGASTWKATRKRQNPCSNGWAWAPSPRSRTSGHARR